MRPDPMLALSIRQPWAWLIVNARAAPIAIIEVTLLALLAKAEIAEVADE